MVTSGKDELHENVSASAAVHERTARKVSVNRIFIFFLLLQLPRRPLTSPAATLTPPSKPVPAGDEKPLNSQNFIPVDGGRQLLPDDEQSRDLIHRRFVDIHRQSCVDRPENIRPVPRDRLFGNGLGRPD